MLASMAEHRHGEELLKSESRKKKSKPVGKDMPGRSETSSRDTLNTLSATEERRRAGRYVAGGTVLAVTLLALHHVLLRGASGVAGVSVPAIIMLSYIIWILYSARRDRQKASRLATAMQLTEVISVPARSNDVIRRDVTSVDSYRKNPPRSSDYVARATRENLAFSTNDEIV